MRTALTAPLAFLALITAAPAQAAEKPLFASPDKIHISIQAPLGTLISNRQSRQAIPGTLVDPSGQRLPITLALRGITRRTSEICDFPPLRVEFRAASCHLAFRWPEAAEARHALPGQFDLPAICAPRICRLPDVQ